MEYRRLLCYVVLAIVLFISSAETQKFNTIKITVYYDAASSTSRSFFIEQLNPAYQIIESQLILELIPFCLAAMQPGTFNYLANVIHQCAFDQTNDVKTQLQFATCLMKFGKINETIEESTAKCTNQTSLTFDKIISCANSDEGRNRLANNGFALKAVYPSVYQLPAIANNGWVNPAQQTRAKQDFLRYVCACLNNPPTGCVTNTNV